MTPPLWLDSLSLFKVHERRVFMEFRISLSIFGSEFRSKFTFFLSFFFLLRFASNYWRQIELLCLKEIDVFKVL